MSEQDNLFSTFGIMSFHYSDTIRFLQFPESIYTGVAPLLRASWPPGIQSERPYAQAYEYKLKGRPFTALGDQECVGSRRLVRDLLAFLHRRGWVLVAPVKHSRHAGSKDSLVFRQQSRRARESTEKLATSSVMTPSTDPEAGPSSPPIVDRVLSVAEVADPVIPPPLDWLVVTMSKRDRVRIIYDAPAAGDQRGDDAAGSSGSGNDVSSDVFAHRGHNHDELGVLVQALKRAITDVDYFQSGEWKYDSFEFKCKGTPWLALGRKTVKVRLLILRLIETLDRFGWQSYAVVQQRSDGEDTRKADTWYFVRPRGRAGTGSVSGANPFDDL